jgi:predicted Zn-dependent protease
MSARTKTVLMLTPLALGLVGVSWLALRVFSNPAPASGSSTTVEQTAPLGTFDSIVSSSRTYLGQGKPAQAEIILQRAVEEYPGEQALRVLLAEALLQLDRPEEALQEFEHACFIGPDKAEYRDFAGTIAAQLGRDVDAEAHYAMAQRLDAQNPKYPLYRAQVQRRLGDLEGARASLVITTKLDPSIAEAWATLADIALETNRPGMAERYIAQARELHPGDPVFRIIEARALRRSGRPEDAAQILMALPEDELLTDALVLRELGQCMGMMGETRRMARLYIDASDRAPSNGEIAFEAALWLERDGQLEEAVAYATRAARQNYPNAAALAQRLRDKG